MSEHLKRAVGANVRSARKACGLTQQQLAERIELSVESVSNIERGKHAPTLETLVAMSTCLKAPVQDLLNGVGYRESKAVHRVELEAQLRNLGHQLPDADLELAVAQVEALARRAT